MPTIDLGKVVGGGDGVVLEQIWQNAAPTASFGSQTIDVNVLQYKGILVTFSIDTSMSQMWYVSSGVLPMRVGEGYRVSTTHDVLLRRGLTIRDTGKINFGNAMTSNIATGASQTINTCMIPQVVYGIK